MLAEGSIKSGPGAEHAVHAALAALPAVLLACACDARAAGPRVLVLDSTLHEFGLVEESARLEHVFRFENQGTGRIRLRSASATCGCTEFEFDRDDWGPGETGELRIAIDTAGRRGAMSVSVFGLLEDEDGATIGQSFSAGCTVEMSELLFCDPGVLDLGEIGAIPSPVVRASVVCKTLSELPAPTSIRLRWPASAFLKVECAQDGSFAPAASADGTRVQADVQVCLTGRFEGAALDEVLVFEALFPDGRTRTLSLPVRARLAPAVRCSPEALFLGAIAAGSTRTEDLAIELPAGEEDELPVRTSAPWIAASWDVSADAVRDRARRLRVEVCAPERLGPFDGWIELGASGERMTRVLVAGIAR